MGYWVITVVGAEVGSSKTTPLVHKLYSQKAKDFVSQNREVIDAIRRVHGATDGRGIFVLDRGGDRSELYEGFVGDRPKKVFVKERGTEQIIL